MQDALLSDVDAEATGADGQTLCLGVASCVEDVGSRSIAPSCYGDVFNLRCEAEGGAGGTLSICLVAESFPFVTGIINFWRHVLFSPLSSVLTSCSTGNLPF